MERLGVHGTSPLHPSLGGETHPEVLQVPPFLAYYGVITENKTLLEEAYNQCSLYRDHLRDKDAGNLWKHIVEGSYSDEGHWSTGACIPGNGPHLDAWILT